MPLLYHAYVYLEFLILACTIYILAPYNIGDRGTRSFKQLTELFAGNGMIGYVAKERVDGKLILPEAVQILKLSGSSKG